MSINHEQILPQNMHLPEILPPIFTFTVKKLYPLLPKHSVKIEIFPMWRNNFNSADGSFGSPSWIMPLFDHNAISMNQEQILPKNMHLPEIVPQILPSP